MQVLYKWSSQVIPDDMSLSTHCSFKEIAGLKAALEKKELLKQFLGMTPFRHFMEISHNQLLVCPLIATILARELEIPRASPDEMWFEIGGRPYRFGKQEFLLVTGLQFGRIDVNTIKARQNDKKSLLWRLFKGSPPSVKAIVLMIKSRANLDVDDTLKLANLVIAFQLFYGLDERQGVDKALWVMIEDVEVWNAFPWGTLAYSILLHHLRQVITEERLIHGRTVNLYGFVWAFQWWLVEMFPYLDNKVGNRIPGDVDLPRFRNWHCNKRIRKDANNWRNELHFCIASKKILVPTDDEREMDYWRSFNAKHLVGEKVWKSGGGGGEDDEGDDDDEQTVSENMLNREEEEKEKEEEEGEDKDEEREPRTKSVHDVRPGSNSPVRPSHHRV